VLLLLVVRWIRLQFVAIGLVRVVSRIVKHLSCESSTSQYQDSSPVNWTNRGYSVTYAGRFVCDFQRSPQDFYFCHSPSRGEWERDRVELTKIQSSRWLSQVHSTVISVTDESLNEWITNDFICLRSDQFQLAVQSRNKSSVHLVGCSLSIILHSQHCILFVWWILISSQKLVFLV